MVLSLQNIRSDVYVHHLQVKDIEFVEADKWYPSSETCSECGYINAKLLLSEREFVCECCGSVIDRDKNASYNLSRYKVS